MSYLDILREFGFFYCFIISVTIFFVFVECFTNRITGKIASILFCFSVFLTVISCLVLKNYLPEKWFVVIICLIFLYDIDMERMEIKRKAEKEKKLA